ncbi:hypothetical protein ACIBQ2_14975 [Micromonospora sediminimaris]|uniref:Uncharacterized protein n=1 Tax=Micromonospora sediminimaris TaxID=547162 RepID=A0A9W5UPY4_9ACTN|nr:hypothetical protein Vse01_26200 [Micromonospora sediminimaris]SFC92671.1 hypothetical protein SAMN05216284_108275 [Micromonospora sediminimaris]
MLARILALAMQRLRNLGKFPFFANGNFPRLRRSAGGRSCESRGLRLVRHMRGRGGATSTAQMPTDALMALLRGEQ